MQTTAADVVVETAQEKLDRISIAAACVLAVPDVDPVAGVAEAFARLATTTQREEALDNACARMVCLVDTALDPDTGDVGAALAALRQIKAILLEAMVPKK